jgi:hypothetical protein
VSEFTDSDAILFARQPYFWAKHFMDLQSHPTTAFSVPPQIALLQMVTGTWVAQSIYVAAKLGIADLLPEAAQHYEQLANATGTHAPSLYRLLRSLASLGIFTETELGYFALTPLGHYLQSNVSGSMCATAIMLGEEHYQAWGHILHSIRTGNSAFEQVYRMPIFDYYAQNPESAKIFDQAMTSFSSVEIDAVVQSYDFSAIQTLVDVAGGHGSLIAAVLKANLHLQGILLDVAPVIEGAQPLIEAEGLASRCQLTAGDFFQQVPVGGDAYMLKHIIHDWDNERSIAILQNCRQAMHPNGRVLVIEQVIPPGNEPFMGKLLDINMLVMAPGGQERTAAEYQWLFEQAGLKLTCVIPTQADVSIVEGILA